MNLSLFAPKRKVIGLDIGTSCAKAVVLEARQGAETIQVREFAIVPIEDPEQPLETTLNSVFRQLRTKTRICALAAWPEGARLRFIDHSHKQETEGFVPKTQEAFRNSSAARIGEYALDMAEIPWDPNATEPVLLECGILRTQMYGLRAMFANLGYQLASLQLTPVAMFNAFSYSQDDVIKNRAYLMLDIGKDHTAIAVGGHRYTAPVAREQAEGEAEATEADQYSVGRDDEDDAPPTMGPLRLIRMINTGWGQVEETLANEFGMDRRGDLESLPVDDEVLKEAMRESIRHLLASIEQTINFAHHEHNIRIPRRVFVSGPLSDRSLAVQIIAEEMKFHITQWNPLRKAEAASRAMANFKILSELTRLAGAAGAGFQYLL